MVGGILSVRANRRGENAVRRATSAAAAPQSETDTYLGRFSSPPSDTFAGALDQAIYRWKAAGVWELLQDFWLTCADTQTDSLRSLITPARDATITGSPTFTALKGFGGFGGSDYVSLPFSTTGVSSTSGQIWAGQFDPSQVPATLMGDGNTHPGSLVLRTVATNLAGLSFGAPTTAVALTPNSATVANAVIGARGLASVTALGVIGASGGVAALTASPIKTDNAAQVRLSAYGLMPTATAAQVRTFLGALQIFLEDIGALD